jgi:phosphomannomutase
MIRWTGYDDALYVAVRALAVLGQTGESLAAFRRRLPAVESTPELRIPCPDDRKAEVVRNIAARLRETGAEIDETDGIRVRDGRGWWLLRPSNTQAVLAARCESTDAEGLVSNPPALSRIDCGTWARAAGKRDQRPSAV